MPADQIGEQLGRILSSGPFLSSQRLCRFLRFVVEQTIRGDLDRLKEFVVAQEVFDRNEKYDPSIDSIVRVEARRLRAKLKTYYEGEGKQDPVLIGLRPGSYAPFFSFTGGQRESTGPRAVSVAVLPFVNMSPEPEQDYFCDGITEEIINALTTVEGLNVVARTSAFQFKGKALDIREVGERLGARVVVEGSVRKANDQLRITAQAIDADTGHHLWSETFRRRMEDVFAIQEEISGAIAGVLHLKLGPGARRTNENMPPELDAYTGYLKGMFMVHQQTTSGLYAALEQFRDLTTHFPNYAQPYAGIAAAYGFLSLFGVVSGKELMPEIRRNAEEAVRLDPQSADGWAVMGGFAAHWDYDWVKGEEYFRRSIALVPGNPGPRSWYSMLMVMLGRFEEAEAGLRRAAQANPLAPADWTRLGYLHYLRGEDSLAAEEFDKAFRLVPYFPERQIFLSLLLIRQREYAKAAEVLARNPEGIPLASQIGLQAATHFLWGRPDKGRELLSRLEAMSAERYVTPLAKAFAYIGMGELDGAFAQLEEAIEDRTVFVDFLNVDPFYEPLRRDARFQGLVRRLNLAV